MTHLPFPPEQHEAIRTHLATDHQPELVLLARAFGGGDDVARVDLDELDHDGLHLTLHDRDGGTEPLWVPFPHRLSRPEHLDREFALLVRTARHTLGLPPADDPT